MELYAERVANKGLCAHAQAESLKYKLLGGLVRIDARLAFDFVICHMIETLGDLNRGERGLLNQPN